MLLLQVFEELTWGIYELHSRGYVHGDLKAKNAVIKVEGSKVRVGLIDFGFTYLFGKETPVKIFSQGFYGSIESTPPEMLAKLDYPQSEHFNIDMFAFGYLL